MCNLRANAYNKRVAGTTTHRPHTPKCPATIAKMNGNAFTGINPSTTPVKAYTKRTK